MDEIGVQLFERSNRGVSLTAAGSIFFEETRAVLARLEHGRSKARRADRGDIGMLSIGFVSIADSALRKHFVEALREAARAASTRAPVPRC